MASLSETLRQRKNNSTLKRGPGGQLTQETPEEIQSLAGKAGLQAPPTTPMEGAVLGANPHQQKMMGTPNQKAAALSLASAPVEQGLSAAVRRQQSRAEMTAEEQAQATKSQDMQNLGSLGDRVTSFIDAQRQKLQSQADTAAAPQSALTVNTADQFQGKDVSGIKSLLEQFRANPTDQSLLLEINKALGYDINTQLDPSQVDQLYESATETIAKGGAGSVDDDLTVSDLVSQPDFGYDPQQLSELLGVPAETVANMSVGQLRSEIERVGQQEFSNTQQLQEQAQSGLLGQAERGLAQQAGREMSATGVRATEADYGNLENQISNADQVTFGGQSYQVDQLLQDETISGIIKDYLESAPDSELRKQIDQQEPALRDFINKNQAVLNEATAQMQAGASEFQATQQFNKELQTSAFGGEKLNDTLMAKIIPNWGQLSATRVDPNTVPLLSYTTNIAPDRQRELATKINKAISTDPTIADQLANLNAQQIAGLGIDKNGSNWDKAMAANETYDKLAATNPVRDFQTLLNSKYENLPGEGQINSAIITGRSMSTLGLDPGMDLASLEPSRLKRDLMGQIGRVDLANASTGNIPTIQKSTWKDPSLPPPQAVERQLFDAVGSLAADGSLSADDLNPANPRVGALDLTQTKRLEELANSGKGSIDAAAASKLRQAQTDKNTQYLLDGGPNGAMYGKGVNEQISTIIELVQGGDPRDVNKARATQQAQALALDDIANQRGSSDNFINTFASIKQAGMVTPEIQQAYDKRKQERLYQLSLASKNLGKTRNLQTSLDPWSAALIKRLQETV